MTGFAMTSSSERGVWLEDHHESRNLHRRHTTGSEARNHRGHVGRRFSLERTTEEQFASHGDERFYGSYGHLRKKLDHTYHKHYVKERQWLHDSIIEEFLDSAETFEQSETLSEHELAEAPASDLWLVLTVGAQGAGKRYCIKGLVNEGKLPLACAVCVDPDEIRRRLPEYNIYAQDVPEHMDVLTGKECGYISETLTLAALHSDRSVILDGCLKDGSWYVSYIRSLKEEFPNLKVALLHIRAELETIRFRAIKESSKTGRTLGRDVVDSQLFGIEDSIDQVKPEVEYFCVIENETSANLVNGEWDSFHRVFSMQNLDEEGNSRRPCRRVSLRNPTLRRRFSAIQSTEENHQSNDMKFYGRFADIRETLDYNYHKNYTFERQRFQDSIINEFLQAAVIHDKNGEICTTPTEPWIVFTAGAMGAGKSYTMKKLVEEGRFPLLAFVRVDPDEIRRYLPEFHIYVNQFPEFAGELTRKEAGYIAEILTLAGLQAGKNVLVDGSLRDAAWYRTYFDRLRAEFPALHIAILHITAPRQAVFQRAAERATATGRVVPQELLVKALEQVPKSILELAPLVDYTAELYNPPNSDDIELRKEGETWENFKCTWMQTCAWVPTNQELMKRYRKKIQEKFSASSLSSSSASG